VDKFNCPLHCELLVASHLFVDHLRSPPEVVRAVEVAYPRKSVLDFIHRVAQLWVFQQEVKGWFDSLPLYRQGFDAPSFFSNVGDHGILEGRALICRANADKSIWLSSFVDTFFLLDEKFALSLEEAIEVLYPICLLVEPYKYRMILCGWIERGVLPQACLAVAFGDECLSKFGGMASGPLPRCTPHAMSPIPYSAVARSLHNLRKIVRHFNRIASSDLRHDTFSCLFIEIQEGVHGAGSLSGQHLAKVLVMTGIVRHPVLATKAVVAKATRTCQRVMEATGCQRADVDIVLRSVADAMGTTPDVAENSGCEATRPHQKYDLFFPGQSVVKAVMAGDGQWHMVRSFPWGTVQAVPFFGGAINGRAAEYKSRRRLFRWWEGPSTTTKLTTKFAPEGQIITRCAGGRKKEPYRKVVFASNLQRQTFRQMFVARSGNVGRRIESEFDALLARSDRTSRRLRDPDDMGGVMGGEDGNQGVVVRRPGPDWSELVELARERYFPTQLAPPSPRAMTVNEVVEAYPIDLVFLPKSVYRGHSLHPVVVAPDITHSGNLVNLGRAGPTTRVAVATRQPAKKKARRKGKDVLPKGIRDVTIKALHEASCRMEWCRLDFCSAASICGDVGRSQLGRPLRRADIECHLVLAVDGRQVGYYASGLGRDYSSYNAEHDLGAVGRGALGWHDDGNGTIRLMFRTKLQAVDHFLLCMVLLEDGDSEWRRNWAERQFPTGSDLRIVPVTRTCAKSKEMDAPIFSLVKCKTSTKDSLVVYAVFSSWKTGDQEPTVAAFPFNF